MFKIFKNTITTLILIAALATPLAVVPAVAYADSVSDACEGLTLADPSASCGGSGSQAKGAFSKIIATVINVLSMIVGALAVIMLIIGGFRYILSNGDSNGTAAAKNTIMYAIIGLVIVLFAQLIVAFVFDRASDASSGGSGGGGNNNSGTNQQQNSNTNGSGTSGNQPNPTTPNDGGD